MSGAGGDRQRAYNSNVDSRVSLLSFQSVSLVIFRAYKVMCVLNGASSDDKIGSCFSKKIKVMRALHGRIESKRRQSSLRGKGEEFLESTEGLISNYGLWSSVSDRSTFFISDNCGPYRHSEKEVLLGAARCLPFFLAELELSKFPLLALLQSTPAAPEHSSSSKSRMGAQGGCENKNKGIFLREVKRNPTTCIYFGKKSKKLKITGCKNSRISLASNKNRQKQGKFFLREVIGTRNH